MAHKLEETISPFPKFNYLPANYASELLFSLGRAHSCPFPIKGWGVEEDAAPPAAEFVD